MKKMLKRLNKRDGFTLAELLIVVAIIAVLVAVSIPVFRGQLQKARIRTNEANARAAYASATAAYLANDTITGGTYNAKTGVFTEATEAVSPASATDYATSELDSFTVVITNGVADVTPKDNNTDGTYNLAN